MPAQEDFFADIKEWSRRKLIITQKYLGGFSRILGSAFKGPKYYIDGFAGRGLYDDGEKGSPVLASELAERLRTEGKLYRLHCINVEKDPENYQNLEAATRNFGGIVRNIIGTFGDNIEEILDLISNAPAFFFLDAFGVKGTDWEAVEKAVARKYPTDLWIRFDHRTVLRLAGFGDSIAKEAPRKLSLLPQIFGIEDLHYIRTRIDGPSPEARVRNAVSLYLEQIENAYQGAGKNGFAAAYPIVSLDGQRKYHLVFACSHPKAATLASNIVNGEEETFQIEAANYKEMRTKQMSFFPIGITREEIFNEKVDRLKFDIYSSFRGKTIEREELHYELMCLDKGWFGRIGRRHFTQALKDLLNETPPKILTDGSPGDDKAKITVLL